MTMTSSRTQGDTLLMLFLTLLTTLPVLRVTETTGLHYLHPLDVAGHNCEIEQETLFNCNMLCIALGAVNTFSTVPLPSLLF